MQCFLSKIGTARTTLRHLPTMAFLNNHQAIQPFDDDHADGLDTDFLSSMVHWDAYAGSSIEPLDVSPMHSASNEFGALTPDIQRSSIAPAPYVVSTAFNANTCPGACNHPPDLDLVSSDDVHFSVSCDMLRLSSCNGFAGSALAPLSSPCILSCVYVEDDGNVLNIILHVAYGASFALFTPTFQTLASVIRRLSAYGLDPKACVFPGSVFFDLLRSHAALTPLKVYCVAGAHDLDGLAQIASGYLLSYPLYSVTDAEAEEMGALYLKRLFLLHHSRIEALKSLLEQPPHFHPEAVTCSFTAQKGIACAWANAVTLLVLDAKPDMLASVLQKKLGKLKDGVSCSECNKMIDARVWTAAVDWTMTSVSI